MEREREKKNNEILRFQFTVDSRENLVPISQLLSNLALHWAFALYNFCCHQIYVHVHVATCWLLSSYCSLIRPLVCSSIFMCNRIQHTKIVEVNITKRNLCNLIIFNRTKFRAMKRTREKVARWKQTATKNEAKNEKENKGKRIKKGWIRWETSELVRRAILRIYK